MSQLEQDDLLARAAVDRLTPGEQRKFSQLLNTDAAFLKRWQDEKRLRAALEHLPNVRLSSNFTAQVVRAVELHQESERRRAHPFFRFPRWSWAKGLSGVAVACVALVLGVTSYKYHRRAEMAHSLSAISEVTTVMTPASADVDQAAAILTDFDAISRLSSVPEQNEVDMELLVALQQ